MRRFVFYTSLFLALTAARVASASSVYLNNVNIDGVISQRFEKATVRIDEKGNVFIDAPGYAAKVEGAPAAQAKPATATSAAPATAAEPAARITKRYWLVTEQAASGMTDYDIDVFVNSKWVRKLKSGEEQIVHELTHNLVPGKNTVVFTAHKLTGPARRSFSAEHYFRVLIGEGNVGGENVMIDNTLVKFERTAAESTDISQEYAVFAR